ncbi:hypothetical protein ACSSS7_000147 [Eimeria intestinalis]
MGGRAGGRSLATPQPTEDAQKVELPLCPKLAVHRPSALRAHVLSFGLNLPLSVGRLTTNFFVESNRQGPGFSSSGPPSPPSPQSANRRASHWREKGLLLTLQQQQLYVHLKQQQQLLISFPTFMQVSSKFPKNYRPHLPPTAPQVLYIHLSLAIASREVLSRVSVDPTSSLYAANLQAAEAGPMAGRTPGRGPPPWSSSSTSVPQKVRSVSLGIEVGPLSTCTTTSQAQGPPSMVGLEPAQVEEAVCEGDSSPFRFSSNVSSVGTLDFDGPLGSAGVVATMLEVGPPARGTPMRPRAPSLSPEARPCSPARTSSSGSSPLSSCSTPPLLAAATADSASSFSFNGSLWTGAGGLLSEAAGEGGPPPVAGSPHLTAGMQRPPWVQQEPSPPLFHNNSANSAGACQQQQRLFAPFGPVAAAGSQEEETRSEGPCSGGPHRSVIRHRRRHCRQQTPWDSCSSSRGSSRVAAAAVMQQSSEEGLLLSRRTTAHSAPAAGAHYLCLEGGETRAAGRGSVRSRSTSLKGHLQRQQQLLLWQQQQQQRQQLQQQQGGEEEDLVIAACPSVSSRRSETVASVGSGGVSSSGDSRLLGVCFSPPKDVWRARITVDGRQFEQQFSVKRHGFDGARLLATRWRAQMETARLFRAPTPPLP